MQTGNAVSVRMRSDGGGLERRSGVDRRQRQRSRLRFMVFGGRRTRGRRFEDRQRMMYYDRYHQSHFSVIVLILFFSVMDALLTLDLIQHGAVELNPIMAYYLDVGPLAFLLVKYGLTSLGLMVLLAFKNFFMSSVRIQAGAFLYLVLAAFMGVVSWQIYLLHRVVA